MSQHPGTLTRDRIIVSLAAIPWLGGTAIGAGLVGDGVSAQAQGLFTDHATLIAPHGPAFTIWSVVYLGLFGYVLWQWLPTSAASAWAARTRIPAAVAIALNGVWLLVVQAGWVWLSVIVMAGIVVSLGLILRRTAGLPRESLAADLAVSLTFGLYLGWICVATCANIASMLVGWGVPVATTTSTWITVAVLVTVVGVAAYLLRRAGHLLFRVGLAGAVVWGTAWVATGRFVGELRSESVGYAAAATAVAVALAWAVTEWVKASGRQRPARSPAAP